MALYTLPRSHTLTPANGLAERRRTQHAERLRRYGQYLRFYGGEHWDHLPALADGRTRLTLNYARAVVDKGVSYLLGRGVNVAVPEDDAAEKLLYAVADANNLAAADLHAATNAAVLGDAVYKVSWDAAAGEARVANLDPFAFFPTVGGDDPTRLLAADIVYALPAEEVRSLYGARAERATAWVVERWSAERFEVLVDDRSVRAEPNPYGGLVPLVHVPNLPPPNSAWGVSDLRDVIPLNQEINARLSDQAESIKFHSDPPVVFKGVQEHTDLPVGAGTVWDIPADADVSLLEWRGQAPSVQAHLEMLFRALYEVAETPRTAFGDSGRILSGVALETELRPLILRTLRKRIFWEAAFKRRNALVLRLARRFGLLADGGPLPRTRVIWPPLVPRDDEAEIRNNVTLVQAGLRSRLTAIDALGAEDARAELARIRQEAERAPTSPSPQEAHP